MDRYLPPEFLFDAQLDIPATLAANMATFQGAPLPRDLLQRWMRYAGPRQEPPGRIPVIWVAEFVELTIRGRDLEGEGQAAIEAQAGAAASGGAGSSGHAAPRVTAAARGGEEQAAVKARAKAMNDLFGNPAGRGQRVLQDHPTNRRADHRTLALEVATLYVVNALGVRAAGGSKEPEEADEEPEVPAEGTEKGKGKEKEECKGLPHLGDLTWAKQREKWKQEGLDSRQIRRLAAQIQLKALRSLPIFVMKNGGTYYSSTMLKYILGVEHHAYILFRLMRDVNRSGESDSDAEEWTDASGSDDEEEEDPGWRAWERVQRNFDRQVDSYIYAAPISSESGAEAEGGASGGGASSSAGQQAGESAGAVATTAGRGRLDLVMQALEVRTPEALAALVVVSADTYRLPLEETATMAVDQLRSASSPEDADKLWRALVKALGDKLNEEPAGTGEAKEEEEEEEKEEKAEEEEGEEKEEEILGKVLEWGDPVVRRGPLQRPVRIKDWKIDPADLNWGAQLLWYNEVRAEQRE